MLRWFQLGLALALVSLNPLSAWGGLLVFTNQASFSAAAGPTQLIDFDTDPTGMAIPHGATIDLQYQAWGVDFNPFNGGIPNALGNSDPATSFLPALSSPNQVRTVPDTRGGGGLEAVFSQPTSAVGLFLGDVEFTGSTFSVLDTSGQSLGSLDLLAQLGSSPLEFKFLGVVSTDRDIARLQLAYAGNDYITLDNLEFAPAQVIAVPEPLSLTLFAVGLMMVTVGCVRSRPTKLYAEPSYGLFCQGTDDARGR